MRKYVKLQIIKHALQYYIERPDASQEQQKQEKEVLKQITQEVEDIKKAYKIVNQEYQITHSSGEEFIVQANGKKHARKKAFINFQKSKGRDSYEKFIKEITMEEVLLKDDLLEVLKEAASLSKE